MRLRIHRSSWQAFGTALSLEAVAVGGLLAWWALHPVEPALRVLPLEIETPTPTQELVPPAPVAKPLPSPAPQPRSHTPPPPAPVVPPALPVPVSPEPATTLASPVTAPAVPPAPAVQPPAPAPAPVSPPGPSAEYTAKVHAAVQAVFTFPLAAKAVGFAGRARVSFTLHGVTPVAARVVIGSGMAVCDREALREVQTASYPPPPPELKGVDTTFDLWVEFKP